MEHFTSQISIFDEAQVRSDREFDGHVVVAWNKVTCIHILESTTLTGTHKRIQGLKKHGD